jgi:hypothetical protein
MQLVPLQKRIPGFLTVRNHGGSERRRAESTVVCDGKAMRAFGKRRASVDGKRRFPGLREESIACVSIPQAFFGSFFGLKERTTMRFTFTNYEIT